MLDIYIPLCYTVSKLSYLIFNQPVLKPLRMGKLSVEGAGQNIMQKLRILVIDDNPANIARAVEQFSDPENYELITAASYMQAGRVIYKYKENETNFDVVLTDLLLPEDEKRASCPDYESTGKLDPYGITLAFEAMMRGVKMIAIVTTWKHGNTDHFIYSMKDAVGNTYDCGNRGIIQMGGTKFFFCDDVFLDGKECDSKNWQKVLEILLAS